MNHKKSKCTLTLNNFHVPVYLGVTAKEQAKKQTVLISLKINFAAPPLACNTGEISDTVCYDKLTREIKKFCQHKKFTLIETLAAELFFLIRKNIAKKSDLYLKVAKQHPLSGLEQSIFEISG